MPSDPPLQQNTFTDPQTGAQHTEIRWWPENGGWHATEAHGDEKLIGRGQTPTEAITNYLQLIEDTSAAVSK